MENHLVAKRVRMVKQYVIFISIYFLIEHKSKRFYCPCVQQAQMIRHNHYGIIQDHEGYATSLEIFLIYCMHLTPMKKGHCKGNLQGFKAHNLLASKNPDVCNG